eukprot:3939649-Rhodomonas_salina.2
MSLRSLLGIGSFVSRRGGMATCEKFNVVRPLTCLSVTPSRSLWVGCEALLEAQAVLLGFRRVC